MAWEDDFLGSHEPRNWASPEGAPKTLTPSLLFLGGGDKALEVALASRAARPRADDSKMWQLARGAVRVRCYSRSGNRTMARSASRCVVPPGRTRR